MLSQPPPPTAPSSSHWLAALRPDGLPATRGAKAGRHFQQPGSRFGHPVSRPDSAAGTARAGTRAPLAGCQPEQAGRRGAGAAAEPVLDCLRGCEQPAPLATPQLTPAAGVVVAGGFYTRWGPWGYMLYCVACAAPYLAVPLLAPATCDQARPSGALHVARPEQRAGRALAQPLCGEGQPVDRNLQLHRQLLARPRQSGGTAGALSCWQVHTLLLPRAEGGLHV